MSISVTLKAAFGSKPTDATFTYTTISNDGKNMTYSRGRTQVLNRIDAGLGSITLMDIKGDYDPTNTASPRYPNVVPMCPVQASITVGGVTYNLFQHFVEQWPRTARIAQNYQERSLTTVDGFELLANAGLAGKTYAQELTGTRIANVLNDAGWPAANRTIATGRHTEPAVTFTADDATKALGHIQDIIDDENGLFYIDGSGNAVFLDRYTLVSAPYTTSQATFSDTSGYTYTTSVPVYGKDEIINDWRGTRTGGTTQIATDATSQAQYFLRSRQVTMRAIDDNTVLASMQYRLAQFKNPLQRIESITVMPADNETMWGVVLGLEIGDRITVTEQAPGHSTPLSADYNIQGLNVTILPGTLNQTKFTFSLWPADVTSWFILNDATSGKLSTSNKLGY